MKKIFTLMAAAVMALAANAKDFTDNLAVSVYGTTSTQEATISVDEAEGEEGTYDIKIADFSFEGIQVGDINIDGVKGTTATDGTVNFEKTETTISFMNSTVILNEGSKMKGDKLYLDLDISAAGGLITVDVVFGNESLLFNKDFTEDMSISMWGLNLSAPDVTVNLAEQADGTYTLKVNNFMVDASVLYPSPSGTPTIIGVGTITVEGITATTEDNGRTTLKANTTVNIEAGDAEGVDSWLGTAFSGRDIVFDGYINGNDLAASITIDAGQGQTVTVIVGDYVPTGIDKVTSNNGKKDGVEAIYDLNGRKLSRMQKGINIIRKADGTTVKVLKK